MIFYCYILYSPLKDKYYIGQTFNLDLRFKRHNSKRVQSTKFGVPWILVYVEKYSSRKKAIAQEQFLKSPAGWNNLKSIKEKHTERSAAR